jgi:hypothetical protein
MNFSLDRSIEILERTPTVLSLMLDGISTDWTTNNEGAETWSAYDVIGHLIHGEKTDWMPRAELILSDNTNKNFITFNRFAQFEESKGKTLKQLLNEFKLLRERNIAKLLSLKITDEDLQKKGIHPAFEEVSLLQLLATWVVHDLDHIVQISRVMAKQYKETVGPWVEYLKVLRI